MKIKKITAIGLITMVLLSFTPTVLASPMGGWSEEEGYFTIDNGVSLFAASKPQSHTAEKEFNSNTGKVRVIGNTKWKGKYHYTRARFERWFGGGVESDSGRVWGTSSTKAVSGWNSGDLVSAKTYWGS